jgi:ribosome biogenesis protein BMS1
VLTFQVGKTTLIKSLVRRYTKQTLTMLTGPITLVTSKKRRLTLIECPSDSLASMIDIAKVVDIVLLMIDGNYGFEMETMEFLNVLSSSGMPGNVFGILTHLDLFKKPEALKMQKKRLKHRFWSELYQGAKLFYLSGVANGRYPDREVLNLSRFLSVMKKPRPLIWRQAHPYCLADRFLDITPPTAMEQNPKCDRTVALYGYLRGGVNFSADGGRVHIPGLGDLDVTRIESLPDPCPTPMVQQAIEKATGKSKNRRLGEKQKVLYAPMSDVGGVLVDKDAVYIDVKTNTYGDDEEDEVRGLGEQLMINLQGERKLLGIADSGLQLFAGDTAVAPGSVNGHDSGRRGMRKARVAEQNGDVLDEDLSDGSEHDDYDTEDEEPDMQGLSESKNGDANGNGVDELAFADSDSDLGSVSSVEDQVLEDEDFDEDEDDDEDEEGDLQWKSDLNDTATKLFGKRRPYRVAELAKLMYDDRISPKEVVRTWQGATDEPGEMEEDGEFFNKAIGEEEDEEDRMVPVLDYEQLEQKWNDTELFEQLRKQFTTIGIRGSGDPDDDFEGLDDEGDGEFEDLETGEKFESQAATESVGFENEREKNALRKEELKSRFEEEDRDGFMNGQSKPEDEQEFGEDDWYDAQKSLLEKQQSINKAEFDQLDEMSRIRIEGFKAGTYARIILKDVPYEFCAAFKPKNPVIIGGLTPTEDRFGYIQVRIKRHRWHKKILKTNDPLIFSLGWRRFQTMPIYSISDSRTRNRMLKYTPEHMHCFATIYGPLISPASPFCCVQSFSNANPGFRIAATGVVLNVDESVEIVKKLKLTGTPYKIFRNTAFIKEMFNSSLEIAKFEGASIKTVSGIRGQIKRALSKPEGHFRATFEDKILMSDIVFLRAWYPIKPHRYYNPVTNLLESQINGDQGDFKGGNAWIGMRLTGEVRRSQGLIAPQLENSTYRKVEREDRHFNPLRVPRKLAADLPFKSQPVQTLPQKKQTYMQKRAVVAGEGETKARNLMQQVLTLRKVKVEKRRVAKEKHREVYRKKVQDSEEKRQAREKREKDEFWEREGRKRQGWNQDGGQNKRRRT